MNKNIESLRVFLLASKGVSQSSILKEFLKTLIKENDVSESGSILVYNSRTGKLQLFNDDNFLFSQGFLKTGEPWQHEFDRFEGIAGKAFRTRTIIARNDIDKDKDFIAKAGDVPIETIVCAPILVHGLSNPFGVVSFHNSKKTKTFDDDTIALIGVYVEALASALAASSQKLTLEKSGKIFIVYGRDKESRLELENFLRRLKLDPVVLKDKPKTGTEILEMLDEEIAQCGAAFILLTPDDEGRLLKEGEMHSPRARQNVILESGYLIAKFRNSRRVCFLVKEPVEFPSDLKGLLFEQFKDIPSIEGKLSEVLKEWRLIE